MREKAKPAEVNLVIHLILLLYIEFEDPLCNEGRLNGANFQLEVSSRSEGEVFAEAVGIINKTRRLAVVLSGEGIQR